MKLVRFDGDNLGLLTADDSAVVDLTDHLGLQSDDPLREFVIGDFDLSSIDEDAGERYDVADIRLESPVKAPGKIVAAPSNYAEHQAEMRGGPTDKPSSYFLKAPSSIIGPDDTIELPFSDRRFDHEIELAFVMAEDVKDLDQSEVLDTIFGYTILLDISMRGDEDRSSRKSYDTFTVVGPAIVTPDEVGDPHDLDIELRINGETKQDSNTSKLIRDIVDFVELSTVATTIPAGDLVTTGTPSGVGPLSDGDEVYAEIENVGSMTVDVKERDVRHADYDIWE